MPRFKGGKINLQKTAPSILHNCLGCNRYITSQKVPSILGPHFLFDQRFSGKKGKQISASSPWGLAAQFAETASNGSLEAVEVEVDPVVSEPAVEEVWLGEQGSPTKSGGVVVKKKHDFCAGSWVFFFWGGGFWEGAGDSVQFFCSGWGRVWGSRVAAVWLDGESFSGSVAHEIISKNALKKSRVSSSSLRWPWNSHLLFTICRCISSPVGETLAPWGCRICHLRRWSWKLIQNLPGAKMDVVE